MPTTGGGSVKAPEMTVGEVRGIFARVLGIDRREVGHYAAVVETTRGLEIKFCCDHRDRTASLLREGADALLSQVGISLNDRPPPPMPARCMDPDCDGDAGHDGQHYQWVPE